MVGFMTKTVCHSKTIRSPPPNLIHCTGKKSMVPKPATMRVVNTMPAVRSRGLFDLLVWFLFGHYVATPTLRRLCLFAVL